LVNSKKRYLSKCMAYILILCSIYSFAGADEVNNEVRIQLTSATVGLNPRPMRMKGYL
jgi:hypothetical protein